MDSLLENALNQIPLILVLKAHFGQKSGLDRAHLF